MRRIRVLLIDESVVRRDLLRASLSETGDLELVGAAPNSRTGLARAQQTAPDVVILSSTIGDLAADELVGQLLGVLPDTGVLLLSERRASAAAADLIVRTLEAGAFDLVFRSDGSEHDAAQAESLTRGLLPKIRAFSAARYSRVARQLSATGGGASAERDPKAAATRAAALFARPHGAIKVVTLGISTGGPEALSRLLPALPASFPVPVVVVIHMPSPFTRALATALDREAPLPVQEAQDRQALQPGVYVAPGGRHLALVHGASGALTVQLSDGGPENGCKPSADVLFRSAGAACPGGVLAVIMTGMGIDGVKGLEALKRAGGYVLAQDESSSIVWGMPGSAVRAGVTDEVLPLDRIARRLLALVGA